MNLGTPDEKMKIGVNSFCSVEFRKEIAPSKLTQKAVAQKVGNINAQFISNIERGLCPAPVCKSRIRAL